MNIFGLDKIVQFCLGMSFSYHSCMYIEYFLFMFLLKFSFKINANYITIIKLIWQYDQTFSIVEKNLLVIVTMKYGLLFRNYLFLIMVSKNYVKTYVLIEYNIFLLISHHSSYVSCKKKINQSSNGIFCWSWIHFN